jgi:hypothetical protein
MTREPAIGFTAAELRTLVEALAPFPLTGRFARPLRRHLVACLTATSPKVARKISRLTEDGFERLCNQILGQLGADA